MLNIAFTSTGYGPLWAPAAASWLRAVAYGSREFTVTQVGKIGAAGVTDRTYTMTAENAVVQQSLNDPTITHIFMTEMDMILPHDTLTKLVALDKDITSGLYFLRSDYQAARGQPCLYKKATAFEAKSQIERSVQPYMHGAVTLFPTDRPFRVDCAGLGCTLFKRHVFEKLEYPWFDLKAGAEKQSGYGSDMYFYTHSRQAGFELWIDPTVQCKQIDYYETDIEDYKWQLDNNPAFAKSGFIIGLGGENEDGLKTEHWGGAASP